MAIAHAMATNGTVNPHTIIGPSHISPAMIPVALVTCWSTIKVSPIHGMFIIRASVAHSEDLRSLFAMARFPLGI